MSRLAASRLAFALLAACFAALSLPPNSSWAQSTPPKQDSPKPTNRPKTLEIKFEPPPNQSTPNDPNRTPSANASALSFDSPLIGELIVENPKSGMLILTPDGELVPISGKEPIASITELDQAIVPTEATALGTKPFTRSRKTDQNSSFATRTWAHSRCNQPPKPPLAQLERHSASKAPHTAPA